MQDKNIDIIQHKEIEKEINLREINILEYLKVILKYKWLIVIIVLVGCIGSFIYSRSLPKVYSASAYILQPHQAAARNIGGLLAQAGGMGGLAGMTGLGAISGGENIAYLWIAMMKNKTIVDNVVNRLDLMKVYNTQSKVAARSRVLGGFKALYEPDLSGIVSVTYVDADPKMAALIANAFVDELDKLNKSVAITAGKREKVFLENRLEEAKKELIEIEDIVTDFGKTKTLNVGSSAFAAMQRIGALTGQIMSKEIELKTMLSYSSTENNPDVQLLRAQINELKQKINELKLGGKDSDSYFIPATKVSDLKLENARLLRTFKLRERMYEMINAEYEMAKVEEAKDTPTVEVLSYAEAPESPSGPNTRMIIEVYTASSAFLGILLAFFIEYSYRYLKHRKDL